MPPDAHAQALGEGWDREEAARAQAKANALERGARLVSQRAEEAAQGAATLRAEDRARIRALVDQVAAERVVEPQGDPRPISANRARMLARIAREREIEKKSFPPVESSDPGSLMP